jgi:excisionase family DNA binding protein
MRKTAKQKFYTVTQAAESSGVTVSYVRQLLRAGKLQGEKIGERAWILPSNQIDVLRIKATSGIGRPRKLEK